MSRLFEEKMEKLANPVAPPKCCCCGKFIGQADLDRSHFYFEPLSEYGPEVTEWTCWRCYETEAA